MLILILTLVLTASQGFMLEKCVAFVKVPPDLTPRRGENTSGLPDN